MNSLPHLTPEQAKTHRRATRIHPLRAVREMRASRDPDDTAQAVRMLGALSGKSIERTMRRFHSSYEGRQILARDQSLLEVLVDREAMMALPEGSFGRTYAEWMTREELSAEGLVAASEAASRGDGETEGPYAVLLCRVREMHDLLHVITGYGRDLVGEIGVLAFTYAQTRHSGIAFLLSVAYFRSLFSTLDDPAAGSKEARSAMRRQMREGYRRGRKADWIIGADWEALLKLPITEVRERFQIPEPPVYHEVRSKGAPILAA